MPSVSAPDAANLEYDYIICGGGTSGCVIAGRLAEAFPKDGPSILIVEAGPDSKGLQSITMVGGLFQAMGGELDWDFKTVPQKHMNNRVLNLARGKFLGGSSGFNGTLCIRGSKADYDEWELDGWSGDEMFRCMKKAETFHGKDWFHAAEGEHGHDGPLHTEPHDPAPISDVILQAMQQKGLPRIDDVFTTGESANACGHVPRSVHKGTRSFATDYLRGYEDRIDIMVRTVVDKIILERHPDGLIATGIVIASPSGPSTTIKARREVIISSGTYCSPTILLRTGIGPASQLTTHNIPCAVPLPGVGANFQDHLVTFVPYSITAPNLTHDAQLHHPGALDASLAQYAEHKSGLFASFPFGAFAYARLDEQLAEHPLWQNATPPLSTALGTSTSSGSEPTPDRDPSSLLSAQPHVELTHTELYSGHIHGHHTLLSDPSRHAFEMMTLLFAQQSRGTVALSSADPFAAPVIDPRYLSEGLDEVLLVEGVRFAHALVRAKGGLGGVLGAGFLDVLGGRFGGLWDDFGGRGEMGAQGVHREETDGEGWEEYVREYTATAHHPAGTCRMGKVPGGRHEVVVGNGDAGGEGGNSDAVGQAMEDGVVVDERLRVLGVRRLRVADCSVLPKLNGGHTQMVAYAVGERAAELLVEDWKRDGERGEGREREVT